MMKKRLFGILLALTLCLTLLPTAAWAMDPPTKDVSYTYSPGNDATGMTELADTLTAEDGWKITTDDNGRKTYQITILDLDTTDLRILAGLYTRQGYEQTKWTYEDVGMTNYRAFGDPYFSYSSTGYGTLTPYWTKTDVSTVDELTTAITEGATKIKLINDITISSTLTITGAVTLDLNGHVLKRSGSGSVIKVISGGSLTLQDSNPDAVHNFTVNDAGLWVLDETGGTKTVTGGVITGGRAIEGGGVHVDNGTFTMNGGSIVGCTAAGDYEADGGGVYVSQKGEFTMTGGSIIGCTAKTQRSFSFGGGVFVSGSFIMSDGAISDCTADKCSTNYAKSGFGGGVYVNATGSFTMTGGSIVGCKAIGSDSEGGGVHLAYGFSSSGSFTISGTAKIETCTASCGSGVYLSKATVLNANGGTINGEVYNNGIITRSEGATDYTTFNGTVTGDGAIEAAAYPYTVTFDRNGGEGTAPAEQKILKGQKAEKPADPTREGYVFAGWSQYDWTGAENLDEETTYLFDFDTPVTETVTLKAWWKRDLSACTVTVDTLPYTGQAQTPSVTITDGDKTLEEGGMKDYVLVADGNSVTSATKPGTYKLTIRGVWAYCGTVNVEWTIAEPVSSSTPTNPIIVPNTMRNPFADVTADRYYYDAVLWAAKNGITGGVDETHFGPDRTCTRAQLVTFLWRAAGCPEPKTMNSFTDVPANAYYAKAVAWAAENGIVDGYGNGLFGSEDTITREQMAVILYRFAKISGLDTTQGGMAVREYSDFERISTYAVSAMQWAVNAGILQGYDGKLMPQNPCTRAQIVTMLYRLLGE